MWYSLEKIEYVKALKIKWSHKADIQVQVKIIIKLKDEIDIQNISIKLVSNKKWFNQIDKRWLKNYVDLWNISTDILPIFQYFCGEIAPYKVWTRDPRRMFIDELTSIEREKLLSFLYKNKLMIVSDILRWRWEFCAEWILVIRKDGDYHWVLKSINEVMNFYGNWEIIVSPRGSIKIWKITIQRKWGDWWRNTANMLQFKIDPTELFQIK